MCRADRTKGGGGLIVYIRSDFCFKVVHDLPNLALSERAGYKTESIVFKVKIGKTWETFVGIYRPPTSIKVPKTVWTYELGSLLEAITSLPGNYFLLGDYNADLIAADKPPKDGRSLLDLLDIYNLHNLISSPTRILKTSITLLDLVVTNNKNMVLTSGVVYVQLSDHSLVYAFLRKTAPKMRSRKLCFRSLKHFDRDLFLADLHTVPFNVMDVFEDVDDKLFVFETLFTEVLDDHAPLKQFHVRGNQVPYMTEEWRKTIRYRNRFWRKFTDDRTDSNYQLYKAQRNKCTSLRRKAIKGFFFLKRRRSQKTQGSFGKHTGLSCIQKILNKQMISFFRRMTLFLQTKNR